MGGKTPRVDATGMEPTIHYSQCWEDPAVLRQALQVGPSDDVLSITSGGCNTLTLLLDNPRSVTAVDVNAGQNYLLELKIAALRSLTHDEFLAFLGVRPSRRRLDYFERLGRLLSPAARAWWAKRPRDVAAGVIHVGRFERYLRIFRRWVLPLVASRQTVAELLALESTAQQEAFYRQRWDSWRWRLLVKLFFSQPVMQRFGRRSQLFDQADVKAVGAHYLARARAALTAIPVKSNYFIAYILQGSYADGCLPPYLQPENFDCLRERVGRVEIVTADLREFLRQTPAQAYAKFNLSDVFEAMTPAGAADVFGQLARVGRSGGVLAYWNNLAARQPPASLASRLVDQPEQAAALHRRDRAFFYRAFHVTVIGESPGYERSNHA